MEISAIVWMPRDRQGPTRNEGRVRHEIQSPDFRNFTTMKLFLNHEIRYRHTQTYTYFRLVKIFGLVFVVWIDFNLKVKYVFFAFLSVGSDTESEMGVASSINSKLIFLHFVYLNSVPRHWQMLFKKLQCVCTVRYRLFSYRMRVRHGIIVSEYSHILNTN